MVSHLFYYQLAVLALAWLFVMLHVTESKPGLPAPPMPAKPKRPRCPEPKLFAGLTHKPHCALCERETVPPTWADENQRYEDKICIGERRNFCSRARSPLRGICYCVGVRFWVK